MTLISLSMIKFAIITDIETLPSIAKLKSNLKKKVKEVHIPHGRIKLGALIGKGKLMLNWYKTEKNKHYRSFCT